MLTIIADANISHLNDYFNTALLGVKITLITMAGRDINADMLAKHQPDVLLVRSVTNINADLLANNHSVKYVGSATIGTDHIDMLYLASCGICFTNASGCSKHSVAQYVVTAILTLRSQLVGKKCHVGIIGLGNIGSTLAKYVQDLGWQVLGYDPFLPKSDINNCSSLKQLLNQSDVVSLHVPLTSSNTINTANSSQLNINPTIINQTLHLINEQTLAMMKPNALLINSARGAVIKESALLQDITENKTLGRQIVLDVFEHEPEVSVALLNQIDIATPHIAGYSVEGKLRGTQMIYETMCTHFKLPMKQHITNLLPDNPYHWQILRNDINQLTNYYQILKDDFQLRAKLDKASGQVNGNDFDALRKNYILRREWKY